MQQVERDGSHHHCWRPLLMNLPVHGTKAVYGRADATQAGGVSSLRTWQLDDCSGGRLLAIMDPMCRSNIRRVPYA